jgi:hypothetical protein
MADNKRPCPQCGEDVFPTDSVCLSCGAQLQGAAKPPPPTAPQPSSPQGPVAPAIGAPKAAAAAPAANWWDGQAASYADWLLWLHLCLCQCPGLIVGLLFLMFCSTTAGKDKGKALLLYSGIGFVLAMIVNVIRFSIAAHNQ